MRTKLRAAVIVSSLSMAAALCLVFTGRPARNDRLSLTFQRYSDLLDPYVDEAAFLWLTNASNKSYLLSMTGGTNTLVMDASFGRFRRSWMVNCEFSDQTPTGWTNWTQQPSRSRGGKAYLSLAPNSGILVRVPLPANGRHRKAAVLCEAPATILTSPFWTSHVGVRVFCMLPQQLKNKVLGFDPVLLRVWCDRELSYPAASISQR